MKLIPLSKNGRKHKGKYFAKVDDEDYERAMEIRWSFHKGNKTNYARGYDKVLGKNIYMHRFIISVIDENITVDHRNHDGFDNQKHNIREATDCQQRMNSTPRGTSKYLGVCFDKNRGKWMARITVNKKMITIGRFDTEEEAARERDKYAIIHHGKFAYLNFPLEYPI